MENETVAGDPTKSERKRLTELASTWGFDIVEVTGDSNCLFMAVATPLQQMMSLNAYNESLLMSHLAEQMGVDTSTSINDIGSILRSKVVQELKGEQVDFYKSFLKLFLFGEAFKNTRKFKISIERINLHLTFISFCRN